MRRIRSRSTCDNRGTCRTRCPQTRRNHPGAAAPRVHRRAGWRRLRVCSSCCRGCVMLPPSPTALFRQVGTHPKYFTAKPAKIAKSRQLPSSRRSVRTGLFRIARPGISPPPSWIQRIPLRPLRALRLNYSGSFVIGICIRLPDRPAWPTTPRTTGMRSAWPATGTYPRFPPRP